MIVNTFIKIIDGIFTAINIFEKDLTIFKSLTRVFNSLREKKKFNLIAQLHFLLKYHLRII